MYEAGKIRNFARKVISMKKAVRVLALVSGAILAASLLGGCSVKGKNSSGEGHIHVDVNGDGKCDLDGEDLPIGGGQDDGQGGHVGDQGDKNDDQGGDKGDNNQGGQGNGSSTEGRARLLAKAAQADPVSYNSIRSDAFDAYLASVERFSEELSARAVGTFAAENAENFVLSPASVYTALATASACAGGTTREELLSALYTTESVLNANYSSFYRLIGGAQEGRTMGCVQLANSIWVDETSATHVRDDSLKTLSKNFYCTSYSADFLMDNAAANKAVRDFVKEQTKGLIDQSFMLPESTVFALVNTLYFRDIWNEVGAELSESGMKAFLLADGTTKSVRRMQTEYFEGRAARGKDFSYFYAKTYNGYQLKVLLPDAGKKVEEIFTPENIALVNGTKDFSGIDDATRTRYLTRLLLPAFEARCDEDFEEILKGMGIRALFGAECDFSPLFSEGNAYCSGVRHVAKLKVDLRGIEGTATTVVPEAGAVGPGDYTLVLEDFSLDRSFAFLITDRYDNTIFAGAVKSV